MLNLRQEAIGAQAGAMIASGDDSLTQMTRRKRRPARQLQNRPNRTSLRRPAEATSRAQ
jgi:hypothetical protein